MEKTLIQTFIDINSQINLDYREKKYPGFIKNIIASNQRKKLYKSINEFTSVPVLEVEELRYYLHLVNDIYGGDYGHCKKIDTLADNKLNALIIVPVDLGIVKKADKEAKDVKDNWTASCMILENEDDMVSISYSLYNEKNLLLTKYTDPNVEVLSNLNRHKKFHMPWSASEQMDCVRDLIAETIIFDIKDYLDQSIKRSERIELND